MSVEELNLFFAEQCTSEHLALRIHLFFGDFGGFGGFGALEARLGTILSSMRAAQQARNAIHI